MAKLNAIIRFLNRELNINKIKDTSRNGLQVRGKANVKKIAFGVDACMELFEKAKAKKCNLVVVHHGLLWKKEKKDQLLENRLNFLRMNNISLYAAHLPLDAHPKYGNNIQLASMVGIKNPKKFCNYHGTNIGYYGEINIRLKDLVRIIQKKLKTKCLVHDFGKAGVKKTGIVSGRAADEINKCKKYNIDTYITGETMHEAYHDAKENRMNVIYAGHYKTETLGVKALMPLLKQKFNIETLFIDMPTGL